jgi:hypothetical protein
LTKTDLFPVQLGNNFAELISEVEKAHELSLVPVMAVRHVEGAAGILPPGQLPTSVAVCKIRL